MFTCNPQGRFCVVADAVLQVGFAIGLEAFDVKNDKCITRTFTAYLSVRRFVSSRVVLRVLGLIRCELDGVSQASQFIHWPLRVVAAKSVVVTDTISAIAQQAFAVK